MQQDLLSDLANNKKTTLSINTTFFRRSLLKSTLIVLEEHWKLNLLGLTSLFFTYTGFLDFIKNLRGIR